MRPVSEPRQPGAWTADSVRRFWQWQATSPQHAKNYFSRNLGHALRNLLKATGALRGRVLDFGCGPGFLLQKLTRIRGLELEGVDFSAQSVEEAEKRLKDLPGFKGAKAIDSLPTFHADNTFDMVTCIEVVEHLTDDQLAGTIREVHRLLRPGGTAVVTTPCDEDLQASENFCPFCNSTFHNMQHMRAFKPAELAGRLKDAGFQVVFCDGIDLPRFQPERRPKWLDKSLRYMGGVTARAMRDVCAMAADAMTRRPFPLNARFRVRARPGDNLVAVARKP